MMVAFIISYVLLYAYMHLVVYLKALEVQHALVIFDDLMRLFSFFSNVADKLNAYLMSKSSFISINKRKSILHSTISGTNIIKVIENKITYLIIQNSLFSDTNVLIFYINELNLIDLLDRFICYFFISLVASSKFALE